MAKPIVSAHDPCGVEREVEGARASVVQLTAVAHFVNPVLKATGDSESELVRRGLRMIARERNGGRSALDVVGVDAGRFKGGPKDLSTNRKHLKGFGR